MMVDRNQCIMSCFPILVEKLYHAKVLNRVASTQFGNAHFKFYAGSKPACSMLEICNDENMQQWFWLEIRLNAFFGSMK